MLNVVERSIEIQESYASIQQVVFDRYSTSIRHVFGKVFSKYWTSKSMSIWLLEKYVVKYSTSNQEVFDEYVASILQVFKPNPGGILDCLSYKNTS
jgi:hypothetical protein